MRTAFFGGTFDPVHNGHLSLAREVLAQGRADRVLLVPAPEPPHKELTRITPYEHRLAMVRLAVGDDPRLGWSDVERRRKGKSYTIDTLAELSAAGTFGEVMLLIGSDSLRQLHLWYRCHELVRDYGLIVYPRPGEPVTEAELCRHWSAEETGKLLAGLMGSVPEFPVSSTQIREIARKGELGNGSGFVLPEVADYINEHRLYSN